MSVKAIQHDAVGSVKSFELFLHKWGVLAFQSNIFWVFGLTFQHGKVIDKQSGKILSCDGLDNLPH